MYQTAVCWHQEIVLLVSGTLTLTCYTRPLQISPLQLLGMDHRENIVFLWLHKCMCLAMSLCHNIIMCS
jgi:hypothetical protein